SAGKMRIRIDIRIVSDDLHAHRLTLSRDFASNASKADYAEGLACEFDAFEFVLFPLPMLEAFVSLRNVARKCEQHCNRVFGRRRRRAAGRIHDENSTLGRGINIDVVDADAGASDNLE